MGLGKSTEKLDEYYVRLNAGKAKKIKPSHVDKVAKKLQAKETALLAELEAAETDEKRERLERKLDLVHEQKTRAKWLAKQLE